MGFHRRPAPQLACKRSTDHQQPGREDYDEKAVMLASHLLAMIGMGALKG